MTGISEAFLKSAANVAVALAVVFVDVSSSYVVSHIVPSVAENDVIKLERKCSGSNRKCEIVELESRGWSHFERHSGHLHCHRVNERNQQIRVGLCVT